MRKFLVTAVFTLLAAVFAQTSAQAASPVAAADAGLVRVGHYNPIFRVRPFVCRIKYRRCVRRARWAYRRCLHSGRPYRLCRIYYKRMIFRCRIMYRRCLWWRRH